MFEKCLSGEDSPAEADNGKVYVNDDVYYFAFKMQPITEDDIAKVIKNKQDGKNPKLTSQI